MSYLLPWLIPAVVLLIVSNNMSAEKARLEKDFEYRSQWPNTCSMIKSGDMSVQDVLKCEDYLRGNKK